MSKKVIKKTYQATKSIQLDTYCKVNGQRVSIEFRGGTINPRRNGTYQTSDPDVIRQMDADIARVGSEVATYRCISQEEVLVDGNEEIPTSTGIPSVKNVPDIKTVTAAREWLVSASETGTIKQGITPSMIKNRNDVLRIAGENQVNFIDLPIS